MKILHTADWHLGQNFFDQNRLEEQACFLDFLFNYIQSERIDLLIVTGDIFDTANPPRSAEELYYNFTARLHSLDHCQTLIIGGNHDSASHLDAPRKLLAHFNIHVVGALPKNLNDVLFHFEAHNQSVCIAAVPYLRDRDVRLAVEGEPFDAIEARTKAGVVKTYQDIAALALADRRPKEILIATGHLTAVGGNLSSSERSIHIGNLGSISADQFNTAFDYIALGHLHEPQSVGNTSHIRYSGSPIPLSFSESRAKEIRLLTITDNHQLEQQSIPLPTFRRLCRFSGSLQDILHSIEALSIAPDELHPWIEATLTQGDSSLVINDQIREAAAEKGAEVLKVGTQLTRDQSNALNPETALPITEWNPIDVFQKRLDSYQGDIPPETLTSCFNHVLNTVHEEEES